MARASLFAIVSLTAFPAAASPGVALQVRSEAAVPYLGSSGEPQELTPKHVRTSERPARAEALGLVLDDPLAGEARQPLAEPSALGARAFIEQEPFELGLFARDEQSTNASGLYGYAGLEPLSGWSLELAAAAERPGASESLARQARVKSAVELASGLVLIAGFGESQLPSAARTVELGGELTLADAELALSGFEAWSDRGRGSGARVGFGLSPVAWIEAGLSAGYAPGFAQPLVLGSGVELGGALGQGVSAHAGFAARWLGVTLLDLTASARIGLFTLDLELANLLEQSLPETEAAVASDAQYTLAHPLGARGFAVATPRTILLELGVGI